MATPGVQVQGLNRVVRDLQAFGLEVDDLKDAFAKIADEGAERAAAHAPRLSGTLADDVRGNRAKSKAVVTAGRAKVPYAGAQNYGWRARNIQPSGFMQKASDEMEPIALRRLEDEANRQLRRKRLT